MTVQNVSHTNHRQKFKTAAARRRTKRTPAAGTKRRARCTTADDDERAATWMTTKKHSRKATEEGRPPPPSSCRQDRDTCRCLNRLSRCRRFCSAPRTHSTPSSTPRRPPFHPPSSAPPPETVDTGIPARFPRVVCIPPRCSDTSLSLKGTCKTI